MSDDGRPVAVLGLGNVLMGDDALGPWVVRQLEAVYRFPEGVTVLDVGTPGLDLTPYLTGLRAAILVDTVKSNAPPGTLRLYRREAILAHPPQPRLSPHDPGVKEALLALEFAGTGPAEVLLVGVVPESVAQGPGLTRSVREAIPRAAEAVVDELRRLGVAVVPRDPPGDPDIWWEERPS